LPNKPYSGHRRTTKYGTTKEHVEKRWAEHVSGTAAGGRWRRQQRTELDGDK